MVDSYASSAPGVWVEEITPTGVIAGAGTSTAAFIGVVTSLPADDQLDVPVLFTNWTSFVNTFGGYTSGQPLAYAVRGFFDNGGSVVYVVPVADATKLDGAIGQLARIHDVSLVCLPGISDTGAQNAVIAHCKAMRNRFAVLDGAVDPDPTKASGPLQTQRGKLTSDEGYAALYWPWIMVDDPTSTTGDLALVPPSGHVAGIMARSDGQYGVQKAPANETVLGARDIGFPLDNTEQGQLNALGINAIRTFAGTPPTVWGARTISANTAWRYVNVRRLVSFIEDSIQQGVRWAVFAPNNTTLWKQLERTITEFMTRVWQSGALFGRTAAEAFYVNISDELNPPAVRDLGEVIVEIGLAPVRPAEFVVLRFGLWDGPQS